MWRIFSPNAVSSSLMKRFACGVRSRSWLCPKAAAPCALAIFGTWTKYSFESMANNSISRGAVDQDGDVIDNLVQPRRDQRAAERFFRRRLCGQETNRFVSLLTN